MIKLYNSLERLERRNSLALALRRLEVVYVELHPHVNGELRGEIYGPSTTKILKA